MVKVDTIIRIKLPEGVDVSVEGRTVKMKGSKGELEREFSNPYILILKEGTEITIKFLGKNLTRNHKKIMNSYNSHINNMINGVNNGYTYKLKICSGHFPMSVGYDSGIFYIKNFLGEKVPRKFRLIEGVNVKIEGDIIIIEGPDKEKVGKTLTLIEQSTKVSNRDRRIFQDGIYLISKENGD